MDIFYQNVGKKLPANKRQELPQTGREEGWFWVVHCGTDAASFVEQTWGARDCIRKGGAILFISDDSYGGVKSEAAAHAVERPHGGRVHCLGSGCTEKSVSVQEHIERFLMVVSKTLAPGDPIPWHDVDPPPTHENLLAHYLFLKALETSEADQGAALLAAWREMPNDWKTGLISAAIT